MKAVFAGLKISTQSILLCFLIASAFGVYADSLRSDFVWDDTTLLLENYHRWNLSNLKELLLTHDNLFREYDTGYYRPLVNLFYLIDRYIWGREPFGYHLTNIILHVLSTLSVFFSAKCLLKHAVPSFVAGLLFALHPVHTETVAWINGRNNAIAGLFYLMAFYHYARYRRELGTTSLFLSLLFLAGSLFGKEYALTFPFIILLYEASHPDAGAAEWKNRISIQRVMPYLCVIAGYLLIRSIVLPARGAIEMQWDTLWFRMLTVPDIFLFYLKLLAAPVNLSVFYDISLTRSISHRFIFNASVLLILLKLWVWSKGKDGTVFFGFGWILITILPVLNIIPLSYPESFLSERYLYIPSFGFCLIVARLFEKASCRLSNRSKLSGSKLQRIIPAVFLLLLIEFYGFETLKRGTVWRNELTLWFDTVRKTPKSYRARCNLAISLRQKGRFDEALAEAVHAVRLNPGSDTTQFILGVLLFEKGRFKEAEDNFQRVLAVNPLHPDAGKWIGRTQERLVPPH